jgi:LPS-assembly lipoprotein
MKRYLVNLMMTVMFASLVGCGFQLRSSADLADNLKTMYVQGIDLSRGVGKSLNRGLKFNGVNVLESYEEGASVLTILEHKIDRRVLSVGGNAKVSEYELHGVIRYQVTDDKGEVISKAQSVEAYRDYRFDENQVLAKAEEEEQLRDELEQQLIQSLLRRLSALK